MLTLWESVENKCEGDGSRAALPLCTPPCGPLRSKNMGRTSNWECAMIWYLVSHIETLQNTISSRTFLYNVSPTIDSYEALYSIISHTIRTHRSSHNETRNIRHFTHPQSDVSTLFSSVPWKGGAGENQDCATPMVFPLLFPVASQSPHKEKKPHAIIYQ